MTHWKLTLSYDGSGFAGWQVQPGQPTVQGALAAALHHMTGERLLPQGSGRTDAGVHALAQVASFTLQAPVPAANLLRALNRILPPSIRILDATPVDAAFHARHSARRKTYEYRLFEQLVPGAATPARICSPFLAPHVWSCRWPLAVDLMQHAASQLCGTHDFTSFAAADPDRTLRTSSSPAATPNPIKTVFASMWTAPTPREDGVLLYRITGSGFLHHMVRNLVGTLVEIGRGSLAPDSIPRILAARNRAAAGPTAPATGLFLHSVDYDDPATPTPATPTPAVHAS